MRSNPILLEHQFTLLCEGAADQNFFLKLLEMRGGYPPFNCLDPKEHHGATNFNNMLKAIQGDQKSFSRQKGVLILADSASDPQATFQNICDQVQRAGNFPVPTSLSATAFPDPAKNAGMPAVCIILLPTDTQPGCLETLCVKVLLEQYPWAAPCLNNYLSCDQITAFKWPVEKRDKARYHCLVAAINKDDPSKAVSSAFRTHENKLPLIDVTNTVFNPIADRIKTFCAAC